MTPLRFKSILNPAKFGYEYTGDTMTFWETCYRNTGCLGGAFGYYETLGDGDVQHTPLMAARVEHFTDYCASLAAHILANLDDCRGIATYAFGLDMTSAETLQFLASIQHNEKRTQWFNLNDRKVSAAESKRYDKRWIEVPTWANGDKQSVFSLFTMGDKRYSTFELYSLQTLIWDTLYNFAPSGDWEKTTAWQTEIAGDHGAAWKALSYALRAVDGLNSAKRCLDCCVYNSTPREVIAA